jgi:hypothetical protein
MGVLRGGMKGRLKAQHSSKMRIVNSDSMLTGTLGLCISGLLHRVLPIHHCPNMSTSVKRALQVAMGAGVDDDCISFSPWYLL